LTAIAIIYGFNINATMKINSSRESSSDESKYLKYLVSLANIITFLVFFMCLVILLSTNVEVSHLTAFTTCFLSILSAGFVPTLLIILRDY
ncbi:hypothetical protein, partial [Francisella tularensis]